MSTTDYASVLNKCRAEYKVVPEEAHLTMAGCMNFKD